MKIKTMGPAIEAALDTLRKNPMLGPMIAELENKSQCDILVKFDYCRPNSQTDISSAPTFTVYINEKRDDANAAKKWGIKGTKLENSIAHELGHVYHAYRMSVKPDPVPTGLIDRKTGKPMTQNRWEDVMSEVMSRRWDNRSRPPGVQVPIVDVLPKDEEWKAWWVW